jgi:hypothetical protein
MRHLLSMQLGGDLTVSFTSDMAMSFGRVMLRRYDVDWARHGFDDAALDEITEISLRTLHSILVNPGQPARDGASLRRFVARWLGPAVLFPQFARQLDAVSAIAGRDPRRPRTARPA